MTRTILGAAMLALLSVPALAQERLTTGVSTQSAGPQIGFTLRGGAAVAPEYLGSDDYEVGPDLGFELNYLNLGGLTFGDPDPLFQPTGFGVTGSFRYIGERTAADSPELAGLDDVDDALELGLGLRYATPGFEAFGAVRYGVVGHEAWVGELGADVRSRPTDRLTLRAGPRVFFGDGDYASTYFGVTPAEAAASAFPAYDASGGLLSAGIELGAGYRFNDDWGLDAAIRYDRLQNDAADSPISADDTQLSARIGVTRRFTFGF